MVATVVGERAAAAAATRKQWQEQGGGEVRGKMERHRHILAHLGIDIRAAAELAVVPGTPAVSVAAAP